MKTIKRVLRPQRLRQVPAQFSWVDQSLVRGHFIDRCEARAAALYLFLVTVADAQGLSYYGEATLGARLHLSPEALVAARAQLIDIDLIAYEAPLYQVLALPGTCLPLPAQARVGRVAEGTLSLAQLIEQMERRRAQL
jgi:hypothetical protein